MSTFLTQLKNDFANIEDELDNELSLIPTSNKSNPTVFDEIDENKPTNEDTDSTDGITTDYQGEMIHEDSLFDIGGEDNKEPIKEEEEEEKEEPIKRNEELLMETKEIKESNQTAMDVFLNKQAIQNELWAFMKKWDSFTEEEQEEIIGDKNLLDDFTPEEAINVVEEWEESKRVHIGDIIESDGVRGVCVGLNIPNPKKAGCFYYLVTNGGERPLYFDTELTIKTEESISLTV